MLVYPAAYRDPGPGSGSLVGLPAQGAPYVARDFLLAPYLIRRIGIRGILRQAHVQKLTSLRLVRCAPGLDVGKHHPVQAPLIDAHPFASLALTLPLRGLCP